MLRLCCGTLGWSPGPIRSLLTAALCDFGFDVWVYTGKFYSSQQVKALLGIHRGRVSGVINGANKKYSDSPIQESFRNKYRVAVHIDNESIIWIDTRKKEYEIIDIKSDKYWANKAFKLIKKQLGLKAERVEKVQMSNRSDTQPKMRISFDLDEVLFVSPKTHKTEPPLRFPLNRIYKERLRLGTAKLIPKLRALGYEVWVYTTSYRSVRYIRRLFGHYGVRFDGIINGQRHEDEVQGSHPYPMPTKLPSFYQITLHVDDESVVASYGRTYGFEVFELDAPDDEWAEKIIERADSIRQRKFN